MSTDPCSTPSEPKIVIDEDWKSRVEAEREAAAATAHVQPGGDSSSGHSKIETPASPAADAERAHQLPPATLSFLITTLATQAMVSLGDVPNPLTGKSEVRLPEARHFIDTLGMLDEKTKGNRTPEESDLLDGFLHQLRMAF